MSTSARVAEVPIEYPDKTVVSSSDTFLPQFFIALSKVSSVYGLGGVVCLLKGLISITSTTSFLSTNGSKSSFSSLLYTSKYPLTLSTFPLVTNMFLSISVLISVFSYSAGGIKLAINLSLIAL